jgi:hypothetical protein
MRIAEGNLIDYYYMIWAALFEWMRGRAREGQTYTEHVVLYYGTKTKGHGICVASLFPSSPLSFSPSGVIPRNFE